MAMPLRRLESPWSHASLGPTSRESLILLKSSPASWGSGVSLASHHPSLLPRGWVREAHDAIVANEK